jgi:hypothetical protein
MTPTIDQLPDMVKDAIGDAQQADKPAEEGILSALTREIIQQRADARKARRTSGIEDIWLKAEEAYHGIDDANRAEFGRQKWQVPTNSAGPLTRATTQNGEEVRSTVFVRLTARYVDAGSAKLQEILLPPDEKAFSFEPTPVPDLIEAAKDETQVTMGGVPLERNATPQEMQQMQGAQAMPTPPQPQGSGMIPNQVSGSSAPAANGQPALPPGMPLTHKDLAQEAMDLAADKAKKAEKRIYDWMVEAKYTAHMRRVLFDGARLGVGVLKAPFPCMRKSMAVTKGPDGTSQLKIQMKLAPDVKAVSAWNLYPSGSCGENIQNGDYIFELDHISGRQLYDLRELEDYHAKAIDQVLKEGPSKLNLDNPDPSYDHTDERYDIWYYYGLLSAEQWAAIREAGNGYTKPDPSKPQSQKPVYAIVTMVNDCIIYACSNPLQSGEFPYHTFSWQHRTGSWAGIGVGEQVSVAQRIVNSATRAMLDNAGKSAGSQIIMDRDAVKPADQRYAITRDKIWFKGPDIDDVRKAFVAFQIPNCTEQMMVIIDYGFKLAEESCNIPLISQGQSGKTTPDTYGAAKLQDNNANQLLRSVGYSVDDDITEPVVNQFYEWLLLDPNVDDDEKGDYKINAHGSASLIERAIQNQTVGSMGELVATSSEVFGVDPKKWYAEYLKSNRLDPRNFQYTEEELAEKAKQPPPMPPQVQAAQIRAQVDLQKAKLDTDRDTVYVQAETQRTQSEHDIRMRELELKLELAKFDYMTKHQISMDQLKTELATTGMKLQAQRELSAASLGMDLHKHHSVSEESKQALSPPTEPAGRAPQGEAFQR